VPHRSIYATGVYAELERAAQVLLAIVYRNAASLHKLAVSKTRPKTERNEQIQARFAAGEAVADLATEFELSQQRIWQIIRGKRK
jgi:Mor family transcriptional regulator